MQSNLLMCRANPPGSVIARGRHIKASCLDMAQPAFPGSLTPQFLCPFGRSKIAEFLCIPTPFPAPVHKKTRLIYSNQRDFSTMGLHNWLVYWHLISIIQNLFFVAFVVVFASREGARVLSNPRFRSAPSCAKQYQGQATMDGRLRHIRAGCPYMATPGDCRST